jgi:hypothetical protein
MFTHTIENQGEALINRATGRVTMPSRRVYTGPCQLEAADGEAFYAPFCMSVFSELDFNRITELKEFTQDGEGMLYMCVAHTHLFFRLE